jgi:predicted enzyme related to lactoylglutathione lyase
VLGFKELLFMPEARLAIVTSPEQPEGTALMLEPNDNPIAKTYQEALYTANIPVMVFGADDIEAEYHRLKEKGVVFRRPPTVTAWGTETELEDGFGNLIKIHKG